MNRTTRLSITSVARPFPDHARISHWEYGHRVGIYRVLYVLERYGIRPTSGAEDVDWYRTHPRCGVRRGHERDNLPSARRMKESARAIEAQLRERLGHHRCE